MESRSALESVEMHEAPVAQLDRASAFEAAANSIQVVASVTLMNSEPSLACSKVAPNQIR
jgi:hypothetical protein